MFIDSKYTKIFHSNDLTHLKYNELIAKIKDEFSSFNINALIY